MKIKQITFNGCFTWFLRLWKQVNMVLSLWNQFHLMKLFYLKYYVMLSKIVMCHTIKCTWNHHKTTIVNSLIKVKTYPDTSTKIIQNFWDVGIFCYRDGYDYYPVNKYLDIVRIRMVNIYSGTKLMTFGKCLHSRVAGRCGKPVTLLRTWSTHVLIGYWQQFCFY